MIRRSLFLAAIAMAAGSIGCTHCDTCSDFPAPGAAAYGGHPVFGAVAAVDATPTGMTTPAPAPAAPGNDAAPPAPAIESKPAAEATPPKPGV